MRRRRPMPAPATPAPPTPAAPIPQPLNLPKGSVRATLALLLCGTLWYLILNGRAAPELLVDSVILVVAFYFGVRGTAPIAPVPPPSPGATTARQPLYLPRGSVRVILLFGFFAVFVLAWSRGLAMDATMVLILQVLGAYLSGYAISSLALRRARRGQGPIRAVTLLRHLIAAAALLIVVFVCATIVFGSPAWLPALPDQVLAWTVAFYFGSRLNP